MLSHYLKPALKRIFRYRLYSAICIASLAVGMTAAILILAFVRYESGFDAMHPDEERLYRLNWRIPENDSRFATFFNPVSPILAQAMPEIESFSRLAMDQHVLSVGDADHYLRLSMVDDAFFELFDYPTAAGDPDSAIRDAGSAVLTDAAARRLFGDTEVLGEVFTVDGAHDFRVGAVVANNPADSHVGSNIFVNIENLPDVWNEPNIWDAFGSDRMYHYVKLAAGISRQAAELNIKDFLRENIDARFAEYFLMQPLRDIHFTPDLQNEMSMVDDILGTDKPLRQRSDISIFSSVALLTLLIASLNFMNMQTVQFSKRAREVAVRRVSGSSHASLTTQLLIESGLMSLFALVLALPLYEVLMPWFASALGMPQQTGAYLSWPALALLALLAAGLGAAAGLYPALTAARLPTCAALRGELAGGKSAGQFRAALIVLQFTISVGLIIGSFTVKNQIDYALSKPLGFDPADVLVLELPDDNQRAVFETMGNRLLRHPGVVSVSAGSTVPARSISDGFGLVPEGGEPDELLPARGIYVDESYFETLGMEMVAGRALSERYATDVKPPLSPERPLARGGLVLNETAARQAGWSDPVQAIGMQFYQTFSVNGQEWRNEYTVVGVVADAHFGSVRRAVEAVTYVYNRDYPPNLMIVKLSGAGQAAVLEEIDRAWRESVPAQPIERAFLDTSWSALYSGEARTFALFIALSTLAVLIACSGLYGLATYNTERRTKEIGVRKVMGGSVWSIVLLLTNDFSRLVLVSNLIAWPLAWFAMQNWLSNFAYRIDLTPLAFVGSGAIALCISWVTVGGQAAKAANAKPVLALRYE